MSPKRIRKFKSVIARKQKGLTVILEDVHNSHNIAAVMRSCDAVGIQDVYLIHTGDLRYCKLSKGYVGLKTSGSAGKWLDLHLFDNVADCFREVRKKSDKIYTTHLSEDAVGLYELDLTCPIALVFGNELTGLSQEALALSDGNFIIPQMGMAQSLNISVACAVSLYEALRQRQAKDLYKQASYSENEQAALFEKWEAISEKKIN